MLMYAQDTFHTELTTLMHDQSATGDHSSGGQESGTLRTGSTMMHCCVVDVAL